MKMFGLHAKISWKYFCVENAGAKHEYTLHMWLGTEKKTGIYTSLYSVCFCNVRCFGSKFVFY